MDIPLKVGMVGVGGFGSYRRQTMRKTGLFKIVSAFDINQAAMAKCVEEEGCHSAGSLDELLDTDGIEAVVICSGAKYHSEQMLAAMERGLHVFVEKPLCSTLEEVKALIAMQRKTGLVIGVGHKCHSESPRSKWLKDLIDKGELGQLATFSAVTAHSGGFCINPGDWRGDPERNPGGMLFQCGVHVLHELLYLFGPLKKISSFMNYSIHTTETADVAQCLLEFESGLVGTLGAYHVTPYHHALTIYGTKSAIYLDDRSYGEPSVFTIQTRSGQLLESRVPIDVPDDEDNGGNLISFYRAVRDGGTPYPGLKDGVMTILACLAAVRSAETGHSIDIERDIVPG